MAFSAIILTLLLFLTCSSAFSDDKCGSIDDARTAYKAGNTSAALKILNCLKKKYPDDLDVRRFFSDIFYWEGAKGSARAEAEDALSISDQDPNYDPFDERRLHFMDRLSRFKLDGDLTLVQSNSDSGADGALEGDYRYSDDGHLLLGAYHTSRIYTGDVEVEDWHFSLGHVEILNRTNYIVNSFEYSPTALISARWGAGIAPHHVFSDDSDVSVEARVNRYLTDTVYQLSPAWNKPLSPDWSVGLQFYSIFTYHWIFAGQGFAEHQLSSRVFSRLTLADGKAVEGPGLEDDFRSANLAVGVRLSPTLSLVPHAGVYRAQLRNENDAGVGFELKL